MEELSGWWMSRRSNLALGYALLLVCTILFFNLLYHTGSYVEVYIDFTRSSCSYRVIVESNSVVVSHAHCLISGSCIYLRREEGRVTLEEEGGKHLRLHHPFGRSSDQAIRWYINNTRDQHQHRHSTPSDPCKYSIHSIYHELPRWLRGKQYGLVARIFRSHRNGRGSIPRNGENLLDTIQRTIADCIRNCISSIRKLTNLLFGRLSWYLRTRSVSTNISQSHIPVFVSLYFAS